MWRYTVWSQLICSESFSAVFLPRASIYFNNGPYIYNSVELFIFAQSWRNWKTLGPWLWLSFLMHWYKIQVFCWLCSSSWRALAFLLHSKQSKWYHLHIENNRFFFLQWKYRQFNVLEYRELYVHHRYWITAAIICILDPLPTLFEKLQILHHQLSPP